MKNFLRRPKEKPEEPSPSFRQSGGQVDHGIARPRLASTPNSFPGSEPHNAYHHQPNNYIPRTHSVYSASSVSSHPDGYTQDDTYARSSVITPPTPYTVSTQQSFGFEGLKLADGAAISSSLHHATVPDVGQHDDDDNHQGEDDLENRLRQFNRDGALDALKNKQWSEAEDYIKEVMDDFTPQDSEDDRADWILKLAEVQQIRDSWDSSFETVRNINLDRLSSLYLSSKVRLLMAEAAARIEKKEIAKLQCVKIIKTCRNDTQLRPFLTKAIQLMTFILSQEGNTKEARFYQSLMPKEPVDEPQNIHVSHLPQSATSTASSGERREMKTQPDITTYNDRNTNNRAQELLPSDSASQLHSPPSLSPRPSTLTTPPIPRADSFTLGPDIDPNSILHKPSENRIPQGHPNDHSYTADRQYQNIYAPGRGPHLPRAASYSGPPAYQPAAITQRSLSMAISPGEAPSIKAQGSSSGSNLKYVNDDDQYSTLELVDPSLSNFSPLHHPQIAHQFANHTYIPNKEQSMADLDLLLGFDLHYGKSNEEIEGKRDDIWRAIMAAIEPDGNPHLAQVLFKEKDKKGYLPLHWAAFHGSDNAALCLLASGAETNVRTPNDWTPLHWAAFKGHASVAKILLDHGANPNIQIQQGNTALHYAAQYNHTEVVRTLLQQGALVGIETLSGFTALHCAAQHGRVESVKLLLQWKTDPNHQTDCGPTPLHCAAQGNALDVAKLLLMSGASVNRRTATERTPLTVAGSSKMKSLLKSYGGTK